MASQHPDLDILESIAGTRQESSPAPEGEEGTFGVGIVLGPGGGLDICRVTPGGSAEQSGSVRVGDIVQSIDGQSNLSVGDARRLMLGRLGTYTTLGLVRSEGGGGRQFKVQLIRGPPDYISLLGLCSKLEAQNTNLESENRRIRDSNNNLSVSMNDSSADAGVAEIIEVYKQKLTAAEDEVLQLRIDEQDTRNLKDRLEWAESDRARLKAELAANQGAVNSTEFLQNRIKELEDQLRVLKEEMRSDRERHRAEISNKEDAMIKNLKRVGELEKDHAASTPNAVKDLQSLRSVLRSRDQQIANLEQQISSLQQQGSGVQRVVGGGGGGGSPLCPSPPTSSLRPPPTW